MTALPDLRKLPDVEIRRLLTRVRLARSDADALEAATPMPAAERVAPPRARGPG